MPATSDLVHDTTTGTGTGNLDLVNVNGKRSFNTAFGNGAPTNVFDYFISNRDAAEWERGTGHMSDSDTLVRDTVLASSNAGAAVNFSAGTKDVTNDEPAAAQGYRGHRLGTATNDSAAAGENGELIEGTVVVGSAVSVTTATPADITSISLTAGDWDVNGVVGTSMAGGANWTDLVASVSTTSATLATAGTVGRQQFNMSGSSGLNGNLQLICGPVRISLASTTTVYLVGRSSFSIGTQALYGQIRARRVR